MSAPAPATIGVPIGAGTAALVDARAPPLNFHREPLAGATSTAAIWIHGVAMAPRPLLVSSGLLSGVLGLGAVACGIWALRPLSRRPELQGKRLAIAGIVLGAIPLLTLF